MYRGKVVRVLDYGAMLQLEVGEDGGSGVRALLHISEVSPERVRSMDEALQVSWRARCRPSRPLCML